MGFFKTVSSLSVSAPKNNGESHVISTATTATDDSSSSFSFFSRTRLVILLLCTLCLSALQSNVLTLNFTVICMAGPRNESITHSNSESEELDSGRYDYSPSEKSMLFSMVAVGALAAIYPMMTLVDKFGTRWVTTGFGFISTISTAVIPLFAYWGYDWLLAARFAQGTALCVVFTLIAIVTRQWSMHKQSAIFIAFFTCFFQFAPIFTMPVSGALCTSSLGWPSVYYLHAAITALFFSLFAYFYREQPCKHSLVSPKELERIGRNKGNMAAASEPVPYKAMLSSLAVWSIWITGIGNFMGIQVTMQFTPTYLNKVMGFSIESTGIFSSVPQIITFAVKMLAGLLADKSDRFFPSQTFSVKFFNSLGIGGMGVFFFVQAFMPTSSPLLALVVLVCTTSVVSFNCGAFLRGSVLMAAQHNHFIMSVQSLINCASALMTPVVVRAMVVENSYEEWRNVFLVFGVMLTVTNIVYCIFGTAEAAEWTRPGWRAKSSKINPAEGGISKLKKDLY